MQRYKMLVLENDTADIAESFATNTPIALVWTVIS